MIEFAHKPCPFSTFNHSNFRFMVSCSRRGTLAMTTVAAFGTPASRKIRRCNYIELAPDELTAYAALLHAPDGVPLVAVIPCCSAGGIVKKRGFGKDC